MVRESERERLKLKNQKKSLKGSGGGNAPSSRPSPRTRGEGAASGGINHYPAAAFASAGCVNSASSGRLIAAWRVGAAICAPVRSVT
jgi:hypothetical protein